MAQLVEQRIRNAWVAGSSPASGSRKAVPKGAAFFYEEHSCYFLISRTSTHALRQLYLPIIMIYELFTHMHQATPEEVERLLPMVSEQRRQEALRYTHTFGQYCCLKSYCMLMELIASVSPTMDGTKPEFAYSEHGKPFLEARPDIHFSISHTKNAILVAISNMPVGADVERLREPAEGLLEKTMNPYEQEMIVCGEIAVAFTELWTQKEAVLKLEGTGILDDLHHVLCDDKGKNMRPNITLQTAVSRKHAYAFSIAQYV